MGQFVRFTAIAIRTCNYKIAWIVRSAARDRDDMINMIALAELAPAIITTSLLTFVLFGNVFVGMSTIDGVFAGASIAYACVILFLFSLVILASTLIHFFSISSIPPFASFMRLFCVSFSIAFFGYTSFFAARLVSCLFLFGIIMRSRIFSRAEFTARSQTIIFRFVGREIQTRCWVFNFAARTTGKRIGDVQHLAPRNANSHDVVGKRYECRRFGLQSLADTYILPQIGGVR